MGDLDIERFSDPVEKREFTKHLLIDIASMERMLKENMFEKDVLRIGAEQELTLVGSDWYPSMTYDKIIKSIDDPRITTELAKFNLEINLDPLEFKGNSLSTMQTQLETLVNKVKAAAQEFDTNVLLTGILPTVTRDHLRFNNMTPNPRYRALNDIIKGKKSANFSVNIKGIDELVTTHPNILLEACNTSFQVHLQVNQNEFVHQYNWAQAIAGPVMALVSNSPLLLGKRLWKETRIALFQQSIDTRNLHNLKRHVEPRVGFGKNWIKNSVVELYQDNITRYNLLFAGDSGESSMSKLEKGEVPKLNALCLHNGTVYMWNRACYGVSDTGMPHLRIENRYIPSGPTIVDEIANAALWLGLMKGMPPKFRDIDKMMSFEDVRYNFFNAARVGMECNFRWMGRTMNAKDLLLTKFIPWAYEGLRKTGIDQIDIDRYLGIIVERTKMNTSGSRWMIHNFNKFKEKSNPREASVSITRAIHRMEETGLPLHKWKSVEADLGDSHKHFYQIGHIMTADIPTVNQEDIVDLVINFMVWRNVRYVAVENSKHELVGLVASRLLVKLLKEGWKDNLTVKDIMESNIITVSPEMSTAEAIKIMVENNVGCLPVVSGKKLLGMITERHIVNATHVTNKF